MDKTQFSHQKLSEKRISLTAGINKRAGISQNLRNYNRSVNMRTQIALHKRQQANDQKTAKINYIAPHQQNINQSERNRKASFFNQQTERPSKQLDSTVKNKYHQLQQKYHKNGPINDRAIQNWLNQILMEYCNQEHFDKSIQNAALKKMSLDRNSLLSQGIKPQYVNRVYKSMFVYSIGFNNLLKELSGKNTHLKKTIWKVYAILLQFCSEGTFQTMIGQIQRDKANKIESLRQQIQKRQLIIQNNDEINEQKNGKIFKELKFLRQQNTNLQNEKNVLMQDFKQAEQSFNQQVSLRLKFQNKINQIHGIHHELSTKHGRLYDDYHKKVKQIQVLEGKYKEIVESFLVVRQKLIRTEQQLMETKRDNEACNEQILKYQQMRGKFQNSEIQLKNSKDDLLNIIKQKCRKISQLQTELKNSEIMLNLSRMSNKQLQQQYRQQLQQNKKLHTTIRDQMNQLNQLFSQKKSFNEKHMSYVAEIQFLKNKDSQNKILIQKYRKQIKEQTQTNSNLLLQKTSLDKKLQNLEKSLNDCYSNIQNMKKTKNIYEDQLVYLKKKSEVHGEIVRQKDTLISTLTNANQKLMRQNEQFITLNKTLDSKITVLAQRLKSQQEINKKKYEKLKQQRDQLFKQNSQHNSVLQDKINDLQKYMGLYDKQMLSLKNQRFQRVNLDLKYKQSLQVMDSQNQHIKKLNILISQNNQEIEQWQRKLRNFEYILKQKERLFQVERNSLKMYLDQAKKQVTKKKMYVNPMLLQDLKGLLKRSIQKYDNLLKEHSKKLVQIKNKQLSFSSQIQSQKYQFSQQLKDQQLKNKKKFQQKEDELEYEKQKCKHLQQKLDQFQAIINQNKSGQQGANSYKQKQRKYLNTIKQKSEQIQKLLKQLQGAHDHNNTLIKRISEIEAIISSKNQEISQYQKKITKMTQQIEQYQRQRPGNGNRQKQTLSSKMDDYDQNLLAVMNNENVSPAFQRQNSTRNRPASRQKSGKSNRRISSRQQSESKEEENQRNSFSNQKGRQKSQKVMNPVWRNDLSKKLKNAFNYYQK